VNNVREYYQTQIVIGHQTIEVLETTRQRLETDKEPGLLDRVSAELGHEAGSHIHQASVILAMKACDAEEKRNLAADDIGSDAFFSRSLKRALVAAHAVVDEFQRALDDLSESNPAPEAA
jgi:hypothetical protein